MKKEYIVSTLNALLIPLALLCGMAYEAKDWEALGIMLTISIIVEFVNTMLWFKLNKEIHLK